MMATEAGPGRPLYLELRASRLKVLVEDGLSRAGGVLDYGIAVDDSYSLSVTEVNSMTRRILDNENDFVRLLLDTKNPDLLAIRKEVDC
jgi:hypothetical protein